MAAGYWNAPMRPWLSCRNADVQSLPRGTATRRVHRQRSIISSLPMLHPALNTPFDLRRGEVRIIAKHQFTELPFERSRRREATLCLIVGFEVSKKISHGAVGRRSANTPSLRDFCHVPTLPHQGRDPHYSNAGATLPLSTVMMWRKVIEDYPGNCLFMDGGPVNHSN